VGSYVKRRTTRRRRPGLGPARHRLCGLPSAYGDVEDALTDLHAFSDEVGRLRDAVGASQSYLRLAKVQYLQGLADYLIVIDAERTLLVNQLSPCRAQV